MCVSAECDDINFNHNEEMENQMLKVRKLSFWNGNDVDDMRMFLKGITKRAKQNVK